MGHGGTDYICGCRDSEGALRELRTAGGGYSPVGGSSAGEPQDGAPHPGSEEEHERWHEATDSGDAVRQSTGATRCR